MGRGKGRTCLSVDEVLRAKALAAAGGSHRSIARSLGRSACAIKHALNAHPEVAEEEVVAMQKRMGGTFDGLAQRMVGSISDDDIRKMSTYQRVVAGAIATDKLVALSAAPLRQELISKLNQVLDAIRDERDAREWREEHALPAPKTTQ